MIDLEPIINRVHLAQQQQAKWTGSAKNYEAVANLFAHAPNDLVDLIHEVERLRATIQRETNGGRLD